MITFRTFASGSSGNASLLELDRSDGGVDRYLFDAGISPRRLTNCLAELDLGWGDLAGVLPSHFDRDHVHLNMPKTLAAHQVPTILERGQQKEAGQVGIHGSLMRFHEGILDLSSETQLKTVRVPHDEHVCCAFVIEHRDLKFALATDLGSTPKAFLDLAAGADLLAIESNHCPDLLASSGRPAFLIDRIAGSHGHLSNHQCVEAVQAISTNRSPNAIVLLHLSAECNHPHAIENLWREHLPHLMPNLHVALRNETTGPFRPGRKASLF
ncbi:MAG: MBL fold metallo-hydrolase [Planctomycetota bacterium]|nr:MBL fold metallo-hydrolase [Planctomycetota bacterium]